MQILWQETQLNCILRNPLKRGFSQFYLTEIVFLFEKTFLSKKIKIWREREIFSWEFSSLFKNRTTFHCFSQKFFVLCCKSKQFSDLFIHYVYFLHVYHLIWILLRPFDTILLFVWTIYSVTDVRVHPFCYHEFIL